MKQASNEKLISKIILNQSISSVRLVVALFTLTSIVMKLLYDAYLPDVIDFDIARWTIIVLGGLFFIMSFYRFSSLSPIAYFSFVLYFLSIGYVLCLTLVNHFTPSVVMILILIIGASTVIINSLFFYGVQSMIIGLASSIVFFNDSLSNENTIAFYNLLLALGSFSIVIIVRLKLISSVKNSFNYLERLNVLSIIANKKGEIVFVSPSSHALLGYDPKELIKDGWWQSASLAKGWIAREHILNYPNIIPHEIVSMERSVTAKTGKIVWLNWANSVLPNGNYMGIALDITKYKK
jgi:PAS domain S-box-containing protein